MKHHWSDLLSRDKGHWKMVPNRERYKYRLDNYNDGDPNAEVLTIMGEDKQWQKALSLPSLKEITLHEPTNEQLEGLSQFTYLERLRITHAKPKTFDFIRPLLNLKELVLEYVSGCSDFTPISGLKRLQSLHLENLRRVSSFEFLKGLNSLKYLHIDGTFDWKQPIENFEFLYELEVLEHFSLGNINALTLYPVMKPALGLKNLKYMKIPPNALMLAEYALLEVGLKSVEGASWPAIKKWSYAFIENGMYCLREYEIKNKHPEVIIRDGKVIEAEIELERYAFLGKGERGVKCNSKQAAQKCKIHFDKYESQKVLARKILNES
jgi:hypothetical protein